MSCHTNRYAMVTRLIVVSISLLCYGCTTPEQPVVSQTHLQSSSAPGPSGNIPSIIRFDHQLPEPAPLTKAEKFDVVVNNLPAREVLFTLARDAQINLDIHPDVQGNVTLNALDQTLPQLLSRISQQADIRLERMGDTLSVHPDTPYLQHYPIDYINLSRQTQSTISNTQQVNATGKNTGIRNNSSIRITDTSDNHFWDTLVQNIKDLLRETDKKLPEGSSETLIKQSSARQTHRHGLPAPATESTDKTTAADPDASVPLNIQEDDQIITRHTTVKEAASVIANPENSLISIRATHQQHIKVREFLSHIMRNARRQVMIETTIVEVRLDDEYQQGINWSALFKANGNSYRLSQQGRSVTGNGTFSILTDPASSIAAQISLLSTYGKVKVLSSPRLSVLNNQTAMMRVVDNLVYFTVQTDTITNPDAPVVTTYSTTPQTVPVGLSMSLTPQISARNEVLLNIKPSISRLIRYIPDPNPNLADIHNQGIPQIQTREMESLMRLENRQIAVMGGLMQERHSQLTDAIPGAGRLPAAGALFKQQQHQQQTTELVIFLRPVIIHHASLSGDYQHLQSTLPDDTFFQTERSHPLPL